MTSKTVHIMASLEENAKNIRNIPRNELGD